MGMARGWRLRRVQSSYLSSRNIASGMPPSPSKIPAIVTDFRRRQTPLHGRCPFFFVSSLIKGRPRRQGERALSLLNHERMRPVSAR
jgi:hypothetical protein